MRRFIYLALLLLAPGSCLAANWFVRPTAQGTGAGSPDWNNACTLSTIPWASIATSDTIFVAGGTYTGQNFTPTKDGASSNAPIVLQRAQASNAGCTTVAGWNSAFDSQVLINSGGYMRINHSFISVKGMVASGIKITVPSGTGNYGIGLSDATSLRATNVFISYVEIAGPGSGAPLSYGFYSGVSSHNSYCTIDHVIVHDFVNGMQRYGDDNEVVQYSEFYNIVGGNDGSHPNRFYLGSGTFTAAVFRFNKFHDDNCLGCAYEDTSICVSNVYEGNWFWNCIATQGGITTDSSSGNAINSLYVYNNTFTNVANTPGSQGAAVFVKKTISSGAIQNNIVYSSGGMWVVVGGANNATTDHNFTDSASGDGGTGTITSGSNPFVSATDFHIVSTIGATFPRNKGTSAPGSNWNTDMDGNTRGADGSWDMGAMEFTAAGPDPNITIQPSGTTVNCGNTANFTVTATGNTALSYQWYKNGSTVAGATQSSYTTAATAGVDNGSLWKVVVTDTAGSVTSSIVTLNVELIITQPVNVTVAVNQNATFTVTATACVTAYQWSRNGSSIAGATLSSYTLNGCQLSDSGSMFSVNVGTVGESEGSVNALLTVTTFTNFYACPPPTGSSGNTGLSTGSPWPFDYALSHAGPTNHINMMDGNYPDTGGYSISSSGQQILAINKWKAVITNSTSFGLFAPNSVSNLVIDGLRIDHSTIDGIKLDHPSKNNVIRNCWISFAGWGGAGAVTNGTGTFTGQGILSEQGYGNLFERNLIENGGTWVNHDHGMYISGTNVVARNNVIRSNLTWGIQMFSSSPWENMGNQEYNNLLYNNGKGMNCYSYSGFTNAIFGNTVSSLSDSAVKASDTVLQCSNNIILPSGGNLGIEAVSGAVVYSDYNLSTASLTPNNGPHDVVSSSPNFIDSANGLYWLKSSAPARGVALAGVYGPVNFFGQAQSSVTDIGAFQYAANLANDTRILDPSASAPNGLPDYWGLPSGIPINLQILGAVKIVGNVVLK